MTATNEQVSFESVKAMSSSINGVGTKIAHLAVRILRFDSATSIVPGGTHQAI